MIAGIEDCEQPRSDDAAPDRSQRAAIQRRNAMTASNLPEIARKRRDHEHGLETFPQQNNGSLNERV